MTGEKISGELIVEYEGRIYVIRRSFGLSKKEDNCEILDEVTGENIELPYNNEPGRYFFQINLSTFSKTLFISQLGVMVNKDKEEEIMEKVTNVYNSGEENISVKKAIETLDKEKKQLITTRKLGELDLLRGKRDCLKQELWEGYKLAEENIENEESLIKKKEYKNHIKEQIYNLDLYKKYLKKVKLQKDYKEIVDYLRKGEELKKKQEEISGELKKNDKILNQDFLEEINKDYTRYLSLNDVREEKYQEINILDQKLKEKNREFKDFESFKSVEKDNIKEKVYILKIEQENLEEKINSIKSIEISIEKLKEDLNNKARGLSNLDWLCKYRDEVDQVISLYKEELKELKYKIEGNSFNNKEESINVVKKKIVGIYFLSIVGMALFLFAIIKNVIPIILITIPIFIVLIKFYLKYSLVVKNQSIIQKNKKDIQQLKEKVDKNEMKLESYMKEINCKNYEEFIRELTRYDSYKNYKEGILLSINSKTEEFNNINFVELKEKYNRNKNVIESLFNVFNCTSLQEIIEKINIYENLKKELLPLEYEINMLRTEITNINIQLRERENDLRKKAIGMGLDDIDIMDFHIKLKEYNDKINKMKEIKNNLISVEETYKVLLKDRDIDQIKKEMKDIISNNVQYSYQSEEDIDCESKNKSNELIKIEKEIKDLEHLIEKRYIGKRQLSSIEEEISIVEEKISKNEKEFKALELAALKLREAFGEVRKNIGPQLNSKVLNKFNFLTFKNYKEIKISDDYKLKVRNDNILFDGDILSNGAKDQLYLSLRLSFIEMLFSNKDIPIFLDDAFVQYDDERREKALKLLIRENFKQTIFFTCQGIEKNILNKNNIEYNLIELS